MANTDAPTKFIDQVVDSEQGYTYDGTGCTVVVAAENQAISAAATVASGLTTLVGGFATLTNEGNGDATSAAFLKVVVSGTNLICTPLAEDMGATVDTAASFTIFAVGTP